MTRKKRHPGTLRLRGNSWQLVLWSPVDRKTKTFTLRAPADTPREDLEEMARKVERDLRQEAKRLARGEPSGRMRFSTLLEQFERDRIAPLAPGTQATYRGAVKRFRRYFVEEGGDLPVREIRRGHINGYLAWRRSRPFKGKGENYAGATVSNRTVAKDRMMLHTLFAFAEDLELREGNPVAKVKAPKGETRDPVILSDAEYERLLDTCRSSPMLYAYVLVLGETGARSISEALRLRWEDVKLDEGFIWIPSRKGQHRTKSGKGRWVPMTPRLRQGLREHFAAYRLAAYDGRRSAYLFHHLRNRRGGDIVAGERIHSCRAAFLRAIREANLPAGFVPHDLRHRRVTTWLADGKGVTLVREAVGHADLATTMRYTHLSKEHLRVLVEDEPLAESKELGG